MKNLILILFGLGIFYLVEARSPFPTKEQVGLFMNSETCVLLRGNQLEDAFLKKAVENTWNMTPLRFVNKVEFDSLRKSDKYSFIFISKLSYEDDETDSKYSFLNLVLGDTTNNLGEMPEFASIPLAYANDQSMSYTYALNSMIKFLQLHVKNIRNDYLVLKISRLKYYGKFSSEVKEQGLLLVDQDILAPDLTVDGFKNIYRGEVEFLSQSEIVKRIKNSEEKLLFIHHVAPKEENARGRDFKIIFDTTGRMYYFMHHQIDVQNPAGFTSKDLDRIE